MAVPWLRRSAADLPPRRPGFDPGSVHVGFVVDKVALGQVFPPSSSVFPCQFHSTGAPLLGKRQKTNIIVIFIIGLHNKPHGCSASIASAAGPFTTKKKISSKSQKLGDIHGSIYRRKHVCVMFVLRTRVLHFCCYIAWSEGQSTTRNH
jgi:hypothetical protein